MGKSRKRISDTEMDVLKALWEHGPGTVRELRAELRRRRHRWAYTTVQTLLGRLRDKGYVDRDEQSLAHVYQADVSREELLDQRMGELADEICEGEASPLVLSLVRSKNLSSEDIARLRDLLDQAEAGRKRKRRR